MYEEPFPKTRSTIVTLALHLYIDIYIYIHMDICLYICEELFSKTRPTNFALALQTLFFGSALIAFWKRALHL